MKKILNGLFYVLQLLLLIISFAGTLYVILQMNARLEKNFMENFNVFIPFLLLFVLLIINIFANQKSVKDNLFYNITSTLSFTTIIIVALRAILDNNLILHNVTTYQIDFTYFANFLPFLKILLYGLSIANVLLMFHLKESTSKTNTKDLK